MKYIWQKDNLLFITNGKIVRVLNLQTGHATETTNTKMIKKTKVYGSQEVSSSGKM